MRRTACRVCAGAIGLTFGCSDPVVDDAIDALGPEAPGVPEGPLHRPGQPCVLCHSSSGPGDLEMSFGGTVYQYPGDPRPLAGAFVDFIDSTGATYTTATNCAGNFFVQPADYSPHFPVWVTLRYGGVPVEMSSPIFREGSCAVCHVEPKTVDSAGQVYFAPDPSFLFPPDGCSP